MEREWEEAEQTGFAKCPPVYHSQLMAFVLSHLSTTFHLNLVKKNIQV